MVAGISLFLLQQEEKHSYGELLIPINIASFVPPRETLDAMPIAVYRKAFHTIINRLLRKQGEFLDEKLLGSAHPNRHMVCSRLGAPGSISSLSNDESDVIHLLFLFCFFPALLSVLNVSENAQKQGRLVNHDHMSSIRYKGAQSSVCDICS